MTRDIGNKQPCPLALDMCVVDISNETVVSRRYQGVPGKVLHPLLLMYRVYTFGTKLLALQI